MVDGLLEEGRALLVELEAKPNAFNRYNDLLSLFFRGFPKSSLRDLLYNSNKEVITKPSQVVSRCSLRYQSKAQASCTTAR